MTREDLLELIVDVRRHESEFASVELKSAHDGTPKRLFAALSALANRDGGGAIIFGVEDDLGHRIVGVGDAGRLQEEISGVAAEMVPVLRPEFTLTSIEGRTVVVVEVPEVSPEQRPCYHRPSGLQKGSFIRVGNSNRLMSDYEIFGYVSARQQPEFDREIVPQARHSVRTPSEPGLTRQLTPGLLWRSSEGIGELSRVSRNLFKAFSKELS